MKTFEELPEQVRAVWGDFTAYERSQLLRGEHLETDGVPNVGDSFDFMSEQMYRACKRT